MSEGNGSRSKANIVVPDDFQFMYDNFGFAPAVEVDGIIYMSGIICQLDGDGSYEEQYERGFRGALTEIDNVLKLAGSSLDDVVEMTSYHTDIAKQTGGAVAARKDMMTLPHSAWTAIGCTALADPKGVTEIKVIAHKVK